MLKLTIVLALVAVSVNAEKPLVASDAADNLVLNASSGKVLVNGKDLSEMINGYETMSNQMAWLWGNISAVSDRAEWHIRQTPSPTMSPSSSKPTSAPTGVPTTAPSIAPTTEFSIMYNGKQYSRVGETFSIQGGDRAVQKILFKGTGQIQIDAAGSKAGRGDWASKDHPGAPGGRISIKYTMSYDESTPMYAFVSEMGVGLDGAAGAGGGSTDLRTKYDGSLTSCEDREFLDNFLDKDSLDSRLVVGGGGGGSHGDNYGYWGYVNSPGAGGPNRATTNSKGNNDGGHFNTGATATGPGLDGGASISATYTGSGSYGLGGQPSSGSQYAKYYATGTQFTGMTWPNGGSGTRFANGGGGGGWYGGAGNWPNGGGGSNYATVGTIIDNVGAENHGAGYLNITITSVTATPAPTPVTTTNKATTIDARNVEYVGWATWTQSCQTDEIQDELMASACEAKYAGSSSATYNELVAGTIAKIPTTNDSGNWLIFSLPEPDTCNDHRSGGCGETARNCVNPNAAIPSQCGTTEGWNTNCHSSTRTTMCVQEV